MLNHQGIRSVKNSLQCRNVPHPQTMLKQQVQNMYIINLLRHASAGDLCSGFSWNGTFQNEMKLWKNDLDIRREIRMDGRYCRLSCSHQMDSRSFNFDTFTTQ